MRERITDMQKNGPPPAAPGALYVGEVMHARLKPFGHRFTYRVFSLLADVDRLDALDRMSRFLSVDRRNLVSFRQSDHVERQNETLRQFAGRLLLDAGVDRPDRLLLLAYPRILGYVFNPLSVFFAYDAQGELVALIYCVRNTFGQRHSYVVPVEAGQLTAAGVRQSRRKLFHVSPFIGMDARYDFRVMPPGECVRLRIHETEDGSPVLAATFSGALRPLTNAALGACLLRMPLMTFKVVASIHWQALKLWLKGARFRPSPPLPAESATHRDPKTLTLEPGE